MACDGEIADEEIALIKEHIEKSDLYEGIEVEKTLNGWIKQINEEGRTFLIKYLRELAATELSEEQELLIVRLAVEMIEADNIIQYSEVKFFKKIRVLLSLSDAAILTEHPDKEDWLLPDIKTEDDYNIRLQFKEINFSTV